MEDTSINFSDRKDGEVPWKLKIKLQDCKKMSEDRK